MRFPRARRARRPCRRSTSSRRRGPILIEIFPVHDDFAVRNLGLPGLIGALGACFGRVVSIDSPHARQPGTFSWQATLWHELAHVITLQMSNQRVPRWLTEGISVYEEGRARPEWGRDMEVPFAVAMEQGKVLKLQGSEFRVHQARHDRARVFRGLTARRSHCRDPWRGRAAAAPPHVWRRWRR